jgi:hypothetical protein
VDRADHRSVVVFGPGLLAAGAHPEREAHLRHVAALERDDEVVDDDAGVVEVGSASSRGRSSVRVSVPSPLTLRASGRPSWSMRNRTSLFLMASLNAPRLMTSKIGVNSPRSSLRLSKTAACPRT